jgi:hypothetical protein
MVEEFPPFDGRISPARWKDLPSYRGRISLPIVEENLASWKILPGGCGENSPLWWKDLPRQNVVTKLLVEKTCFVHYFANL